MSSMKKRKDSHIGGYSTRHLRRKVKNLLHMDSYHLKTEYKDSQKHDAAFIEGSSRDILNSEKRNEEVNSQVDGAGQETTYLLDICSSPESEDDDYSQESSHVFQKIAESSETNPQTISQLNDSEHSYNDEEFLKSDVSSDCSLPELGSLRAEYEKAFENESSDAEFLQEKFEKDLHTTSNDEQDSQEENTSETG